MKGERLTKILASVLSHWQLDSLGLRISLFCRHNIHGSLTVWNQFSGLFSPEWLSEGGTYCCGFVWYLQLHDFFTLKAIKRTNTARMTSLNAVFFFLMFFFLCNHSEQLLLIAWGERESDIWLPLPLRVTRASRSPREHKRIPFLATHSLMVALYAKKKCEDRQLLTLKKLKIN